MNCSFKVGKTYKTKDWADVLIIAVDTDLLFPVVGILTAENGLKKVLWWTIDGFISTGCPFPLDLVKPEPVIKTVWINVYTHPSNNCNYTTITYNDKDSANKMAKLLPLYLIGTFPFSFEVSDE